jgi:hypothetical protein
VFNPPGIQGGFYGSLPTIHVVPNKPVVGMVPTVSDNGYFLVGQDGGVFAFGTAPFLGSLPGIKITPNLPIVGIVAANTDRGYFLVGADGGVYAFGTVPFLGSLPGKGISVANVIGIAATPSGNGYWVVQATGKVSSFGTAQAFTTTATTSPVTAIAGTPTGGGYWLVTASRQARSGHTAGHPCQPQPGGYRHRAGGRHSGLLADRGRRGRLRIRHSAVRGVASRHTCERRRHRGGGAELICIRCRRPAPSIVGR